MMDPLHIRAKFSLSQATLWLLASFGSVSTAFAQTSSETFAAASAAFAQQQYVSALSDFEAARAAGMQGAAIDYNIAVCLYKLGHYGQADVAFAQLGERYPAMQSLAAYNRGLALLKLDREEAARVAFEQAQSGPDSNIVALASTMLRGLNDDVGQSAPTGSPQAWFKVVDIALGHDDNVALLEQGNLPAGLSADSPYAELFAQISGPNASLPSWRMDASAYVVKYSDASAFDQSALRLGGNYRFAWRDWLVESGPYWTRSALSGDGFERRLGAAVRMRRSIDQAFNLTVQTGYENIDELDARFAFVAGSRVFLRAGLQRPVETGLWSLDYRYEQNHRDGASVSPRRSSLAFLYRHRFSRYWSGEARYEYRSSRYDDLVLPRHEDLSLVGVAATRDLDSGWQLFARYELSDNDSGDPLYAYRRQRVSVSLGKAF